MFKRFKIKGTGADLDQIEDHEWFRKSIIIKIRGNIKNISEFIRWACQKSSIKI